MPKTYAAGWKTGWCGGEAKVSVTGDILRTYRAPRRVVRSILNAGQREDRALIYLMLACALIFVGQWPRLSREAHLSDQPLEMLVGGAALGWLFFAPLILYGIAALSHLLARLFGGKGTHWRARIALFWALLAVAPLMLLHGLVSGFIGAGPQLTVVGAVVAVAFGLVWGISLHEAERA